MGKQLTKEEVIRKTIEVLESISVPVRLKTTVVEPIEGAINNLAIVLQMIRMEDEANKNPPEEPEPEPEPGMEPLMMPEKKEAGEDGPETDAE